MGLLETEVHDALRDWLRQHPQSLWGHHLTMGRLVSRTLRLNRSALIQTGTLGDRYHLSYLIPALLSAIPLQIVVSPPRQKHLQEQDLPALQAWLTAYRGQTIQSSIQVLTPEQWFNQGFQTDGSPQIKLPTVIDQADYLENWARDYFGQNLRRSDWENLSQRLPPLQEKIRDLQIHLTKALFSRPPNPYECYPLTPEEERILTTYLPQLTAIAPFNHPVQSFWQTWQTQGDNSLLFAKLERPSGQFSLHLS
jgi:ATP-dependent DNA helicase DinG